MKKIFLVITELKDHPYDSPINQYKAFFSEEAANKYAEQYKGWIKTIDLDTCIYSGEEGCIITDINILGFLHFTNKASNELDSVNLDHIRVISSAPGDPTIVYNDTNDEWPDDYVQATEDTSILKNRCTAIKEKLVKFQEEWFKQQ